MFIDITFMEHHPDIEAPYCGSFLVFFYHIITMYVGLGEHLAAEMRKRIMILDGAMGTMIQSYQLSEEHYRGSFRVIN